MADPRLSDVLTKLTFLENDIERLTKRELERDRVLTQLYERVGELERRLSAPKGQQADLSAFPEVTNEELDARCDM